MTATENEQISAGELLEDAPRNLVTDTIEVTTDPVPGVTLPRHNGGHHVSLRP